MPIHTACVRRVEPCANGRFEVWLVSGPMVYTFDQKRASLCDRASLLGCAVVRGTQQTQYGERIVTVELTEAA